MLRSMTKFYSNVVLALLLVVCAFRAPAAVSQQASTVRSNSNLRLRALPVAASAQEEEERLLLDAASNKRQQLLSSFNNSIRGSDAPGSFRGSSTAAEQLPENRSIRLPAEFEPVASIYVSYGNVNGFAEKRKLMKLSLLCWLSLTLMSLLTMVETRAMV